MLLLSLVLSNAKEGNKDTPRSVGAYMPYSQDGLRARCREGGIMGVLERGPDD